MDKEVLEVVLKKSFNDSKIKRIIDMKWEPALPIGENYTSTILKLTLKVVLGNGRIANKTFIAKKENVGGKAAEQFKEDLKFFKSEVLASGFETVKRTEMQDLEHAKLVMRSLGRFHAMAKVLEVRGLISKDDYKPYPFLHDDFYIRNINYGGIRALVKGMKQSWGEEWSKYADKLSQLSIEEYSKRVKRCGDFDDNTFKCLNHGDCWNNNIMFKHNWEGRHIELRFIDYQIPHYNTPCVDVIYFLYTSIKSSVRHQNLKSLIKLYHESLNSSLDRFGYEGSKPSLEDINKTIEQLSFFGMSFFIGIGPGISTERTDALDLNLIMKTNGEEGFNISVYTEDGIIEKVGVELKTFLKSIM